MIEGRLVWFTPEEAHASRRVQGETEEEFLEDVKRAAEEDGFDKYQVERYR